MSNKALQTLQFIFQDRPDVLRLFDFREVDLSGRVDEEWLKKQSEKELFPKPVNFYATGRTGAGKTTLAVTLIDPEKKLANTINDVNNDEVFESSGKTDCTWMVVFFKMRSNLWYFDLPGAGGCSDTYENINRAALMLPQIDDEDEELTPVDKFELWNCSDYPTTKKVLKEDIEVEQWQSPENQENCKPDIILYVVAPHTQFVKPDRKYLKALLRKQKKQTDKNQVIFALNIHFTDDGTRITTQASVEDARQQITKIFQEFYPNESVPIVEIDCKQGTGINQITKLMLTMLPDNKIGNFKQVLPDQLKEFAIQERSCRYRKALIQIASRLATRKVDEKQGNQDLINEAYMAVADYGIRVFQEEDASLEAAKELNDTIVQLAQEAKISREEAQTILVDRIVYNNREVEKSEYVPDFQDVEVEKQVIEYEQSQESRKKPVDGEGSPGGMAGGPDLGGMAGGIDLGQLAGASAAAFGEMASGTMAAIGAGLATGGLAFLPVLGASMFGASGMGGKKQKKQVTVSEDVIKPVVKTITTTENKFMGMKEVKKKVLEKVPEVIQQEQEIGKKYLQGGYPVVENLLAIGLGIESANGKQNLQTDFQAIVEVGRRETQAILLPYKEAINSFAVSENEEEISKILERILF
ncbi:MAG: hypothetical protein F6K26_04940 [Moorea sp. SIO2I5]|nr:hypothetical protein [Moorena sp. SIO2I5]